MKHGPSIPKLLLLLLFAASIYAFFNRLASVSPNDTAQTNMNRSVIDMAGRRVALPDVTQKAGGLEVLAYEKSFLVGQSGKIVIMTTTSPQWMDKISPGVKNIPKYAGTPNMEDLLRLNVDTAFFLYDAKRTTAKLKTAGIPAVITQSVKYEQSDPGAFQEETKRAVRLFGDIYGGDAKKKADEWCNYYDEKIHYVTARTSKIPTSQWVKFYYARGPSPQVTSGHNSNLRWYGQMAAADMVTKGYKASDPTAPMEDVLLMDPEFILVGRQYPASIVLNDKRWREVRAVKEGKVYVLPGGLFFWDGSTEGVLMLEYMAKLFHPDLFPDLDMKKEVRDYFARFYHCNLTDKEVDRYLQGMTP
jgi:iron complex transport system substrate-binding protein